MADLEHGDPGTLADTGQDQGQSPETAPTQPRTIPGAISGDTPTHGSRKIITHYDPKPIPTSKFDVAAWYDGSEGEGPFGYGSTEAEAIIDLQDNFPEENVDE